MDPVACVARILSALAAFDSDEIDAACGDLRAWIRGGGFHPHGWTSAQIASFVTAAMSMSHTLRCGAAATR